jgi:hypothetical protein
MKAAKALLLSKLCRNPRLNFSVNLAANTQHGDKTLIANTKCSQCSCVNLFICVVPPHPRKDGDCATRRTIRLYYRQLSGPFGAGGGIMAFFNTPRQLRKWNLNGYPL